MTAFQQGLGLFVATRAVAAIAGPIFVDGFESGDTTAWSSSTPP